MVDSIESKAGIRRREISIFKKERYAQEQLNLSAPNKITLKNRMVSLAPYLLAMSLIMGVTESVSYHQNTWHNGDDYIPAGLRSFPWFEWQLRTGRTYKFNLDGIRLVEVLQCSDYAIDSPPNSFHDRRKFVLEGFIVKTPDWFRGLFYKQPVPPLPGLSRTMCLPTPNDIKQLF